MARVKIGKKLKEILRPSMRKGEKILLFTRKSSYGYMLPLTILIIFLCSVFVAHYMDNYILTDISEWNPKIFWASLFCPPVILGIMVVKNFLAWKKFFFVVTDSKIIIYDGMILEIDYAKLAACDYKRTLLGLIFNCGNLVLINRESRVQNNMTMNFSLNNTRVIESIPNVKKSCKGISRLIDKYTPVSTPSKSEGLFSRLMNLS